MKYTSTITIHEDIDRVEKLFKSEEKEFSNKRAKYSISRDKHSLTFSFEAEDSTALRAVLNSVAKMLAVYDKTKAALKGDIDE